jgi:hypothetical protein
MRYSTLRFAIAYCLMAFLVTYFFCFHSSPLWHGYASDQSMFSIIGYNWMLGNIPYECTWDSKGPIIFFVNMLGHMLASGENGIFLLQTVNLVLVLALSHIYMRKMCSPWNEMLFQLFFVLAYVLICSGGNQVGDSNLILAAWAIFLGYEWTLRVDQGNYEHPYASAFVYGMFVSSCLLSRLTNAALVLFFIMEVVVVLIYKRLWKNLLINMLWFFLGFATIFLPFAIYFALNDALDEMWYATFTYNVEYAMHSHLQTDNLSAFYPLYYVSYFICLIAVLLLAVVSMVLKRRRRIALIWACSSLLTLLFVFRSYANANYVISFVPVLLVALIELNKLSVYSRWPKTVSMGVMVFIFVCFCNHIRVYRSYFNLNPIVEEGIRLTADVSSSDSFIGYNVDPTYYLYAHRMPCYRFFSMQDWAIENGPSLRGKVRECFKYGHAKWVLVYNYGKSEIAHLLDDRYTVYSMDTKTGLILFKLKATVKTSPSNSPNVSDGKE